MREYLLRRFGIDSAALSPADAACFLRSGRRLPDCGTVLVCTVPYFAGAVPGSVALYARGRDYHDVIPPLLTDAARLFHPGCECTACTDTSPFYEVRLAASAGLGRLGDNGLLITPFFGSYVFIAELLLSVRLHSQAVTEPLPCLHCGRCAAICPTGHLSHSSRECLSAATQRKGTLDSSTAELMRSAHTAWGCDACQLACPLNAAARKTELPAFTGELTADIVLPPDGRAYAWRGEKVLRRNIEIISGQTDDFPAPPE